MTVPILDTSYYQSTSLEFGESMEHCLRLCRVCRGRCVGQSSIRRAIVDDVHARKETSSGTESGDVAARLLSKGLFLGWLDDN